MALVRWRNRQGMNPWSALSGLEDQMDRLFGEFPEGLRPAERAWTPTVDVTETEEAYVLEADLPGVGKKDIELAVVDNAITIKGTRKNETESRKGGYHRFERRYGEFQRTFEIPGGFVGDKAEAKYENGVLRVTLPKPEVAKPKQIDVKVN